MQVLNKSAFAKKQGWSPSYVTKLIGQERIVLDESGKVIVQASLDKIKATAGARGDVVARNSTERKRAKKISPQDKMEAQAHLDLPMESLPEESRAKYKAVTMHFENQLQKLGMALVQGLRFDNKAVRDEALGIGNILRGAMERLVDTTAPRLAIAKTREERARILNNEMVQIRKTLKNAFPRAILRLVKSK